MPAQTLSTHLEIDARLGGGFDKAFKSAGSQFNDLQREAKQLRQGLGKLSEHADDLDALGKSSDGIRASMVKLERQIEKTEKAATAFGNADKDFRNAGIGVRALGADLKSLGSVALKTTALLTGAGVAAAAAFAPSEDLLAFDQALQFSANIGGITDDTRIDKLKTDILELSNAYGISTADIAAQHTQLVRNLGFAEAEQTLSAAVEFQAVTGLGIHEIEDELATARISLGIDTAGETQEFLNLLGKAHQQGIKIDNLDLGDMETLMSRTGEDVFGENFQREFLTTIAFRQVDSFQFADYATAFQEEFDRATFKGPNMDIKDIAKAQQNIATLEKWGLRAEEGIIGAMKVYQKLGEQERVQFFTEIEPILTAMPAEVIARGSEALPRIEQQVETIMTSTAGTDAAAQQLSASWSGVWGRIGTVGTNTLGILQEEFAKTFAPDVAKIESVFDFIAAHRDTIGNFFSNVRDTFSPVISKVVTGIQDGLPVLWEFAREVWTELQTQWTPVISTGKEIATTIWNIVGGVVGFVKDHPKLVATVVTGIAAWKAYRFASDTVKVGFDAVSGVINLASGHLHRLDAAVLANTNRLGGLSDRVVGTRQNWAGLSKAFVATKFPRISLFAQGVGTLGRNAIGAIPGIAAMGAGLWTALAPILPIVGAVVGGAALLAGGAYLIHQNWTPISGFFSENFETIRTVLLAVMPPIGLIVAGAGLIKENWTPISAFFSQLWETTKTGAETAWQVVQYAILSPIVAIKNAWAGAVDFFSGVYADIRDQASAALGPIPSFFGRSWQKIVEITQPLHAFFTDFWGNISNIVGGFFDSLTEKLKTVQNFLGGIRDWFGKENAELKAELGNLGTAENNMQQTPQQVSNGLPDNVVKFEPVEQPPPAETLKHTQTVINTFTETQTEKIAMDTAEIEDRRVEGRQPTGSLPFPSTAQPPHGVIPQQQPVTETETQTQTAEQRGLGIPSEKAFPTPAGTYIDANAPNIVEVQRSAEKVSSQPILLETQPSLSETEETPSMEKSVPVFSGDADTSASTGTDAPPLQTRLEASQSAPLTITVQNTFEITQNAGEDAEALAEQITTLVEETVEDVLQRYRERSFAA